MKLLIENNFISEAVKTSKGWKISGIFMESDTKNRNGRVYPEKILTPEVDRYIKEYVNTNRALGELSHPQSPTINLDRVSHKVTGLVIDGKNIIGEAVILNTPMGEVVKGLLEGGCNIGVSTRGVGSLKEKSGYNEVQDDFKLSAVDIVSDPSVSSAYITGILESAEWLFCEDGQCYIQSELLEKQQKFAKKNYAKLTQEQKFNMFEAFINNIK